MTAVADSLQVSGDQLIINWTNLTIDVINCLYIHINGLDQWNGSRDWVTGLGHCLKMDLIYELDQGFRSLDRINGLNGIIGPIDWIQAIG